MTTTQYRLTLITCAASWLMLGLHLPALHQLTHHGRSLPLIVLALIPAFALIGIGALLVLLRAPSPGPTSSA